MNPSGAFEEIRENSFSPQKDKYSFLQESKSVHRRTRRYCPFKASNSMNTADWSDARRLKTSLLFENRVKVTV